MACFQTSGTSLFCIYRYVCFLKQGENGEFTYQLDDPSQAFIIDPRTGWLTVRDQSMLDREKQPSLGMRVRAKEKVPSVVKKPDNSSAEASVAVEVTVLDANDNNPIFTPSNLYEFTVENDARVGDVIGQVEFKFFLGILYVNKPTEISVLFI
jgi:hypothetical protein